MKGDTVYALQEQVGEWEWNLIGIYTTEEKARADADKSENETFIVPYVLR